jgi:DMSO/TMAO reductase YedYZ heme-binding membrane subunit
MFRRNSSSWTALMDIRGLMALFGMGLVAGFFFCWPLSMAMRGLRRLLISLIFNFIIITLSPFLFLLLLYLFFTPFGIGGKRVTSPWPRAALKSFMT